VSKNFQLFKISEIQRINHDSVIDLADNYILTSYPYKSNREIKLKDASTFKSNMFLEVVGEAIDNSDKPFL